MSDDIGQEVVISQQEVIAQIVPDSVPASPVDNHKNYLARLIARLDVIGVNLDSELTDLIAKAKAIL